VTSLDIQTNPNIFRNRKVFLSNWHDEYWSKSMRDNLTSALNHGENLAFFDANNLYWQFRFEPSTTGVANRVEVCYKQASLDPLSRSQPSLTTVNWRISPVNEPENALLGVMFESGFSYSSSFPWVVTNSSHWIYSGTGLKDGDEIPGLVGNEYDKVWHNGLTPARLTVLSNSPVVDENGIHSLANGTIYTAASKALVFSAGTLHWSWKLDDNLYQSHGADPRVRRMTANLLNAMIHGIPSRHTTTNRALPQPSDGRLTMLLMIVGITLWIALLVVLVWAVMRRINRRAMSPRLRDPQVLILLNPPSAMEILRQRYASGEIDSITFEEIRERLENSSAHKPPIILDSP
jgi:hypothetical protein